MFSGDRNLNDIKLERIGRSEWRSECEEGGKNAREIKIKAG